MERWQEELRDSVVELGEIEKLFPGCSILRDAASRYPLRITRHYLGLIEHQGDPIWKQSVPDVMELADYTQLPDPLHEELLSPVPGLIHRYPDRVVWLVFSACAVYCRFCMRKRHFGTDTCAPPVQKAVALEYIAAHPEIKDVVLSGGDPLLLPDDVLDDLLTHLRQIPHLDIIRIGTRVPVTLPSRITDSLCRMLSKHHPLYLNTHFNHPAEVVPASAEACRRLADAGIQLGNQTVLLRGVNDSVDTMTTLIRRLLSIRVRPYYLHQMDLVQGTAHFRTRIDTGIQIIEGLRGHISGIGVPHYVVDLPGGKGKVPILPEYARKDGNTWFFRNYMGEILEYQDVTVEV